MSNQFLNSAFRDENGKYLPQLSGSKLTHDQMTYNLNLIGSTLAGYKVLGTGPNGDLDGVQDAEKVLKLYKVTAEDLNLLELGAQVDDFVWVPAVNGGGSGSGSGNTEIASVETALTQKATSIIE